MGSNKSQFIEREDGWKFGRPVKMDLLEAAGDSRNGDAKVKSNLSH
ncbi:hypothetical protein OfM1_06750 [Lactovum odontotermitis]